MIGRALLGALLAAAALPAAAHAQSPLWQLTQFGDPRLVGDVGSNAYSPGWWACPPAQACRRAGEGSPFEPGDTARGTTFENGPEIGRREAGTRSPAWLGRVKAIDAPGLEGAAVPGEVVRPVPATWSGGWGSEHSVAVVMACPSPTRTDCQVLTNARGEAGTGDRKVLAQHAGLHLFAVEYRYTRDAAVPALPAAGPVTRPTPSALVAVSEPAGPVGTDPPAATVTLRARALRTRGGATVGSVTCAPRCSVVVRAGKARRTFAVRGTRRLTLPLPRTGRATVRVTVDGLQVASARVRL